MGPGAASRAADEGGAPAVGGGNTDGVCGICAAGRGGSTDGIGGTSGRADGGGTGLGVSGGFATGGCAGTAGGVGAIGAAGFGGAVGAAGVTGFASTGATLGTDGTTGGLIGSIPGGAGSGSLTTAATGTTGFSTTACGVAAGSCTSAAGSAGRVVSVMAPTCRRSSTNSRCSASFCFVFASTSRATCSRSLRCFHTLVPIARKTKNRLVVGVSRASASSANSRRTSSAIRTSCTFLIPVANPGTR